MNASAASTCAARSAGGSSPLRNRWIPGVGDDDGHRPCCRRRASPAPCTGARECSSRSPASAPRGRRRRGGRRRAGAGAGRRAGRAGPGNAVRGSRRAPMTRSRVVVPRVNSESNEPSRPAAVSAGRSSGTNGPARISIARRGPLHARRSPAREIGALARDGEPTRRASRGDGASVSGRSVSESMNAAWRPSRPWRRELRRRPQGRGCRRGGRRGRPTAARPTPRRADGRRTVWARRRRRIPRRRWRRRRG